MNLTPWQYWNWTLPTPGPSTDEQYVEVRESAGARAPGSVRGGSPKRWARTRRTRSAPHALVHLTESLPIRNARFAGTSLKCPARGKVRLARRRREPVAGSRRRRAVRVLRQKVAKKYGRVPAFPRTRHMAAHTYARAWVGSGAPSTRRLAATRADDALTRGCRVWPYGEAHNRAILSIAAAAARVRVGPEGERVACARRRTRGRRIPPLCVLDQHAGFLTAFHDVPKLLVASRFGRWRSVLRLAAEAERRAVNQALAEFGTASQTQKTSQRKLPADFDGLAVAEVWTEFGFLDTVRPGAVGVRHGAGGVARVRGRRARGRFASNRNRGYGRRRRRGSPPPRRRRSRPSPRLAARAKSRRVAGDFDFDEHTVVPGVSARGAPEPSTRSARSGTSRRGWH